MLDMIDQVLDDVILQVNKANAETSEYVKKMLNKDMLDYRILYFRSDDVVLIDPANFEKMDEDILRAIEQSEFLGEM